MSEKILSTVYGGIRTNNESADGYYVLQWTTEPYTLQEDKEMQDYLPITTVYAGEIVCDAVFLNHVPHAKYWYIPMIIGDGDVTVRLKEVLLPNITIIKIDKIKILPKWCNKKEEKKLGAIRMNNDNIDELIEEIHRRDKLDIYFDIQYDGKDINGD